MDKYLISQNGLFRYKIISTTQLGGSKIMYLDYVEDENNNMNISLPYGGFNNLNFNSNIKTFTIKVFDKTLNSDNIKKIKHSDIYKLYEDIINTYYENCFNKKEGYEFDNKYIADDIVNEQTFKNFTYKMANLSNMMNSKSRVSSANTCILSTEMYDKLKRPSNLMGIKNWIINPTKIHNDKIIILYLDDNISQIGISVFSDFDFNDDRILKLKHLMKKIGKEVKERLISYNITNIGNNCKYTTGVIYINK